MIDIILSINENHLHLHTFNKKFGYSTTTTPPAALVSVNTKARLNLLYPTQHELVIEETESDFELSLQLFLTL
ncbi:MAG: hypothetical protein R2822_20595 [Spirosomataceae bacterium]